MISHIPADQRGHTKIDRLDSYHSFSFGEYYDLDRMNFGPLRVLNDDVIQGGSGFPPHSHRDMEIISIPLQGGLAHQDSMNHHSTILPDMIQVMSAGTGITHAEYNAFHHQTTSFLQIWIQPRTYGLPPRYQEQTIDYVDGKLHGLIHPDIEPGEGISIHQDAWIYRIKLKKDDTFSYVTKDSSHGLYLFVIQGSVRLEDNVATHRDAFAISNQKIPPMHILADSDLLLIELKMKD